MKIQFLGFLPLFILMVHFTTISVLDASDEPTGNYPREFLVSLFVWVTIILTIIGAVWGVLGFFTE